LLLAFCNQKKSRERNESDCNIRGKFCFRNLLSVCYACLLDDPKNPLEEWHAGLVHLAATIGKQRDSVSSFDLSATLIPKANFVHMRKGTFLTQIMVF
jgi:hypothetical protein